MLRLSGSLPDPGFLIIKVNVASLTLSRLFQAWFVSQFCLGGVGCGCELIDVMNIETFETSLHRRRGLDPCTLHHVPTQGALSRDLDRKIQPTDCESAGLDLGSG